MEPARVLGALASAALLVACETFPEGAGSGVERVREGVVEANGTTLAWKSYGTGPRAVVFLQGAQLAREMWEEQAKSFADGWRAIFYDVRGFGKSGPTTEPFSHENDLRALLDALEIDRPALVGLSLGGRIALEFAVEHPDRVAALVLVGPGLPGLTFEEEPQPWHEALREAVTARDSKRAVEAWLTSGYMAPAMEDPHLATRIRELALANAANWLQTDTEVPLEPPAIERLSTIRCPTLVLVGSRDVPEILAIADHLERGIPGSRKAIMAACGHVPNLERSLEFERIVREFLEASVPPDSP